MAPVGAGYVMSVLGVRSRFCGCRLDHGTWEDPIFLVMPTLLGVKKTFI